MTKSDLIEHLCQAEKLPKGKAEMLVNAIFDCMEESLRRGERIEIRGFGSFEIRQYKPYDGRNPRTGAQVSVKAKRLPFFKAGKELKERVNAAAQGSGGGHGNGHGTSGSGATGANGAGSGNGEPSSSSAAGVAEPKAS
jgi:integration host factor subunit beta